MLSDQEVKILLAQLAQNTIDLEIISECMLEIQSVCDIMKTSLGNIYRTTSCESSSIIAKTTLDEVRPYAQILKKIIAKRDIHAC